MFYDSSYGFFLFHSGAWPVLIDDFVEHMYRFGTKRREAIFLSTLNNTKTNLLAVDLQRFRT